MCQQHCRLDRCFSFILPQIASKDERLPIIGCTGICSLSNVIFFTKSTYQAQLQQNIAKVIRSAQQNTADGIDEKLLELQKELLKKANNKEAYDEIADEIFKFRAQREKCTVDTAARDAQIARISELQDFIKQQPAYPDAFDEAPVKRWLERIIIWEDHFTVELKSGLNIEIEG